MPISTTGAALSGVPTTGQSIDDTTNFRETVTAGLGDGAGTWVELVASTSRRVLGVWMNWDSFNTANTRYRLELGKGAAGSESTIIPDLLIGKGTIAATDIYLRGFFPMDIPVGTRIAARMNTAGGGETADVAITLLEA